MKEVMSAALLMFTSCMRGNMRRGPFSRCVESFHGGQKLKVSNVVDGNIVAPRARARQHVNPLASSYQQPIELVEDWAKLIFKDPTLPFHVDIGCARGSFCMNLARNRSDINVLGLEIRRPIAAYCSQKAFDSGLPNVGFLSCNANVDLARIIRSICVSRISIQFPDPHWKAHHKKRRVVQPKLIQSIVELTGPNCDIFIQSDVEDVAIDMRERFRENSAFIDTTLEIGNWLQENPIGIQTEREIATHAKGLPVYRALIKKRSTE
jgi:tRNA (guanine-N7-)-methyltransferase